MSRTPASPLEHISLEREFREEDGVWVPRHDGSGSAYEAAWEQAAADDHVTAAIARGAPGETLDELVAKTTSIWDRLPQDGLGTVLDIGCGYGRLALHLSLNRGLPADAYLGVDVSPTMLRHALEYRARFGAFPDAHFVLLQASAHDLPLADDSIDLVISSVVFLHMGRRFVELTLREAARVLRPGSAFVFETSFPNRWCPANAASALRRLSRRHDPLDVELYSQREVAALVRSSGLPAKAGRCSIEPSGRAVLPKRLGPVVLPWARRWNDAVERRELGPAALTALSFSASSL
jgi:arsenite methyltransferase